ncbi:hypothetical protein L484_027283 [Morus notabilis]|uniref:DENR N-terminal domain-containing protein n=1 Tax=Morus notabilis TaxID=981085 RepID=W9QUN3_9ROSA|nr:hypothetical protein L484_027283 [Morus notabilis]
MERDLPGCGGTPNRQDRHDRLSTTETKNRGEASRDSSSRSPEKRGGGRREKTKTFRPSLSSQSLLLHSRALVLLLLLLLPSMAEKPQPFRVLYCAVCSLPAEYCEFGPDFEKCKPWLIQNAPDLYPDLVKDSNAKEADKVAEQLQSTGIFSGGGEGAASSGEFIIVVMYVD